MKHAQVSFTNFVVILLIGLVVQFNQPFFRWLPIEYGLLITVTDHQPIISRVRCGKK